MRRQRLSRLVIEIELLPFLSVLACTIGTLILLILVLTTQLYSKQQEVTIIAKTETGKNLTKTPRYLECREEGIVIYPQEKFVPKEEISQPNSPLNKLLSEIKSKRDREYLIIAVRPEGIKVFREVRNLIEKQGIDLGYEPIDSGWKLKIEAK